MEKQKLEQQINEVFAQIGELYYTEHKNDSVLAEKYIEPFKKIEAIYIELRKLEDAELEKQGLKRCPSCENRTIIESRFCNMCGYRFLNDNNVMQEETVVETIVRKCRSCGEVLEEDALFCANCGQKQ